MPCKCCNNPLQLGCIPSCSSLVIDLGGNTLAGQIYSLQVQFAGGLIALTHRIANNGDNPEFDLQQLNESYHYQAAVLLNDQPVSLQDANLIDYDCLAFSTKIANFAQNLTTAPLMVL